MDDSVWKLVVLVTAIGLAVVIVVLLGVLRELGTVVARLSPARPGEIDGGPELERSVWVDGMTRGRAAILLFLSPGCDLCSELLPGLRSFVRHFPDVDLLVALPDSQEAGLERYISELGNRARPDLHELFSAWEIPGTPYAVGVDRQSRVMATGATNNLQHLEALADRVVLAADSRPSLPLINQTSQSEDGVAEGVTDG